MTTQLVEILPREITFTFEVKKQSSCAVHLANVSDQYVAFKVKTTSPRKYCVRPNVGIIKPKSTCDFTVTMQAQKYAPSDFLSKDKFLIQSTIVPFGTTEEEIIPDMFVKGNVNYIEETKIRVILASAPNSPKEMPVKEILNQEAATNEASSVENPYYSVLSPVNGISKQEPPYESSFSLSKFNGVENLPPPDTLTEKLEATKIDRNVEEPASLKVKDNMKLVTKTEEFCITEDEKSEKVENILSRNLKPTTDNEKLQLKINDLESKLLKAEHTILRLREEKIKTISGKQTLIQDLTMSRRKSGERHVLVGFPPLFVCMVAMISLVIGFTFRG